MPTRKRHQEDAMSTVTSPYQTGRKITAKSVVGWGAVAVIGAVCWTVLALSRGENVSALWILFAALSSYAIAYRFYSRFIAAGCSVSITPVRPRLNASRTA